ncbi:MAG TPA: AAA family ATPase [Acidobacteriaceae bacterium]|nr:AAA family ATPase [Acidobacteriaceae bacterium]
MDALAEHRRRADALQYPRAWPDPVDSVELIETHISTVLLGGDYAYKLKKPVNLGFVDFTRLDQRHYYCTEELRLNRRLAPRVYLDVVAVTEDAAGPRFGDAARVVDWAVKMRRFPQSALLGKRAQNKVLEPDLIERLAAMLAGFHAGAPVATDSYGAPERITRRALENFEALAHTFTTEEQEARLQRLYSWTQEAAQRLAPVFEQRRRQGHVRECHGDLHLDNIILWEGELAAFDCIEFAPDLRWIDTANDIAFTIMDLHFHAQPAAAHHLLNAYLENSGDYDALALIPFYSVYRALVRAKIDALLLEEHTAPETRRTTMARMERYLALAEHLARPAPAALVITYGVSGSGKSTAAQALVQRLGCIRLRSDVERRRLMGLGKHAPTGSTLDGGAYTREQTRQTYARLHMLAGHVLAAGFVSVVDATFLDQAQRRCFADLAKERNAKFVILDLETSPAQLRARLVQRRAAGRDVSEADLEVLEQQLQRREPLDASERKHAITVLAEKL